MSDPLSVLSGAAGLISLGFSVCQGLVSYYQAWSAWEDGVQNAVQDVQETLKFLSLLHARIGKLSAHQVDIVVQAKALTARVRSAVHKLQDIGEKCKAVPIENGERHRLRNFSRRSLYPFKQSTLRELRDTVRQTRESLESILQLLQIDLKEDTAHLRHDVKDILTETERIEQGMTTMRPNIECIKSNVSALVQESKEVYDHVEVIERDLGRINFGLASASAVQTTEFAAFREQLNRIERTIIAVTTSRGSVFLQSRPTALHGVNHGTNISHHCPECSLPETQGPKILSNQVGFRLCYCRKRTVRFESSYNVGWLRFLSRSENVVVHSKSCPYRNPRVEEQSTELAAEYISLAFGKAVKLAIKATRGARGFSISPLLIFRGIVRGDSPVFALFSWHAIEKHLEDFGMYMDNASARMLQLFRDGSASPYDVNELGQTILHAIFAEVIWYVAERDLANLQKLVMTCIDAGVPLNEPDAMRKSTPLESLLRTRILQYVLVPIATKFYDAGGDFGHATTAVATSTPWHQAFEIRLASRLDSWADITECGPLSRAIIQKDEQKVLQILQHDSTAIQERNSKGQSPMHLSVTWPRGMNILLNYGGRILIDKVDKSGQLPITYALENRNYEASELLLRVGSALSSPFFHTYRRSRHEEVLVFAITLGDPYFLDLAIGALKCRRLRLYDFAKESLPTKLWERLEVSDDRVLDRDARRVQKALEDFGIEIPKAILVRQTAATVYQSVLLRPHQAESLYMAGFKDIVAVDNWGFTPLDSCCLSQIDLNDGLSFLVWLTSKGITPCREITALPSGEVVIGVSGYHMIGFFVAQTVVGDIRISRLSREDPWAVQRNVIEIMSSVEELSWTLVAETIRFARRDACLCSCSSSGCSTVTTMLKSLKEAWEVSLELLRPFIRSTMIHWVESGMIDENVAIPSQAAADIIRFETFEALGLTHTCCRAGPWTNEAFKMRCESSEVVEIREEEQDLIEEHKLLVDMFVRAYEERQESLHSFLTGYWRTRMARVLMERRHLNKQELANIRRIGVLIKEESKSNRSHLEDNESETKQDLNPSLHGSEEDPSPEERIADEAWCRILREYCDEHWSDNKLST